MPSFATEHAYPASPERIFDFLRDLGTWRAFRGFGPLPGIASASTTDGGPLALGSRVRVADTDGTVHHEVVTVFDPPRRYAARMELVPPASWLMASIEEEVSLEPAGAGARVRRRFDARARSWWTWPLVWLVTWLLLRPAVRRHDRTAAAAIAASVARA